MVVGGGGAGSWGGGVGGFPPGYALPADFLWTAMDCLWTAYGLHMDCLCIAYGLGFMVYVLRLVVFVC